MQVCLSGIAFLLLFISTSVCISLKHPDSSLTLQNDLIPFIECDPRTKRPTIPSLNDCEDFLSLLNIRAHEAAGAYSWYGRNIGTCDDCVKLPAIIYFGKSKCAALIDVDDQAAEGVDYFTLKMLYRALSDVILECWLQEKQNGRGYPGLITAWAGLIRGVGVQSGRFTEGSLKRGNRTISVIDLDSEGGSGETINSL